MPRGLMFQDAAIRAMLAGRKSQTRRMIQRRLQRASRFQISWDAGAPVWVCDVPTSRCPTTRIPMALFPGMLCWVKEAWTLTQHGLPVYRADGCDAAGNRWPSIMPGDPEREVVWRSTMRMPVWASRLTLRTRSYRIERLSEISEADCLAEGAMELRDGAGETWHSYGGEGATASGPPIHAFRQLWESIHGRGSFDRDPWVERIEFDVLRQNIREVSHAGS